MQRTVDLQPPPPRPPHRPRWRRRVVLLATIALVPMVAGAGLYGWLALRHPPAGYRLDPAPAAAPNAATSSLLPSSELVGRWVVATGSEAGYRIRERLARLPAPSDAVGRSHAVQGEVTLQRAAGGALAATGARVEVDLTRLRSDEAARDDKIFPMFLEPGGGTPPQYPTAIFQAPAITVPASARSGAPVELVAHGTLTIRGQRRDAEARMVARLRQRRIELVGATRFPLERYGIASPDMGGLVKLLDNQVTVEFHLFLSKRA
jgi:polyisoprenoid-binding protein YceI